MTELEQVVQNSQKLRPRTRTIYLASVRAFLAFTKHNPRAWTGPAVEAWRDQLKRSLQPQTVNLYLDGLRYATKRLAERDQDPRKDFARYAEKLAPGPRAKRIPLTIPEAQRLLVTCARNTPHDLRDRAILTLGLRCGIRCAGLCSIDLGPGTRGRGSLVDRRLIIINKGGKPYELPALDDVTLHGLTPWIEWLRKHDARSGPLFRALGRVGLDAPITPSATPLTTGSLYRAVKTRARAVGLGDRVSPHVFRHTCISWMAAAGASLVKIRELTGQKTDDVIRDYIQDTTSVTDPPGNYLPELE